MSYSAKDIFDSANNFEITSQVINNKIGETGNTGTYIAPFITLSALSIELYLKCIYFIENNKPAERVHGLDELFNKLSEESRIVITMIYDLAVQNDPVVNAMKQQFPDQTTELVSVLKETSKAFIKWRYSHEGGLTSFPTSGPLIIALKGRIKILKPEWFND